MSEYNVEHVIRKNNGVLIDFRANFAILCIDSNFYSQKNTIQVKQAFCLCRDLIRLINELYILHEGTTLDRMNLCDWSIRSVSQKRPTYYALLCSQFPSRYQRMLLKYLLPKPDCSLCCFSIVINLNQLNSDRTSDWILFSRLLLEMNVGDDLDRDGADDDGQTMLRLLWLLPLDRGSATFSCPRGAWAPTAAHWPVHAARRGAPLESTGGILGDFFLCSGFCNIF